MYSGVPTMSPARVTPADAAGGSPSDAKPPQAKIEQHRAAARAEEEEVLRLEIAVDDAARVRRLDHGEDRVRAPGGAVRIERRAQRRQLLGEGLAEEPLHREVRPPPPGSPPHADQLRDVRHADALEQRGLPPEPLSQVPRRVPPHLDGDRRSIAVLLRGPDVGEAAVTERPEQGEALDRGRRALHGVMLAGRRRKTISDAPSVSGEPPI